MQVSTPDSDFLLFTSLRYDPILLESTENSRPELSFSAPSPSPFYMLVFHRDRLMEAAQHFEFERVAEQLVDGKALHGRLLQEVKTHVENGGKDEPLKVRLLFDNAGHMTAEFTPIPPVPLETLYPASLDPPETRKPHPAQGESEPFEPSPLTGGALHLGPTDYLPSEARKPVPWVFRLDTAPTPSSPFTLLKTTVRDAYNASRARALPKNPQNPMFAEVLLYNECNELTEGSLTSVYLFRGGRWVTPPVGVPAGEFTSQTLKGDSEERWDEGELRKPFAGRWGHSVRSAKVGAGGQRGTTRRWALSKGMCMEEPVGVDTVAVGEGAWVSNAVRGFGYGRIVG